MDESKKDFKFQMESGVSCVLIPRKYAVLKRTFDIIVSSIALLLSSPIMALLFIIVSFKNSGDIFSKKEVIGLKGRKFNIYKFYNSNENKEMVFLETDIDEKTQNHCDDSNNYRNPIDKLLYGSFTENILKLFNVVLGQMSMIGPKPVSTQEFENYQKWYLFRLCVKPGIIFYPNERKNVTGLNEMIFKDIKYVREQSFVNDMKIILINLKIR